MVMAYRETFRMNQRDFDEEVEETLFELKNTIDALEKIANDTSRTPKERDDARNEMYNLKRTNK
jgi:hypothetical protein